MFKLNVNHEFRSSDIPKIPVDSWHLLEKEFRYKKDDVLNVNTKNIIILSNY